MNRPDIVFREPLILALLLPALLLIGVLTLIAYRRKRHQPFRLIAVAVLRVIAVTCSVMLLSGMVVITKKTEQAFILLVDRSDSMIPFREEVDRHVLNIIQDLPSGSEWKVLGFAGEVLQEKTIHDGNDKPGFNPINPGATDIASAILEADSEIAGNKIGRVILLTDGLMTDGNLAASINLLANRGIRLDAMVFNDETKEPEVQIDFLSLPADTFLGQPFQLSVTLKASQASQGTVSIYEEDQMVHEAPVRIRKGDNTYSFTVAPKGTGIRIYHAEVSSSEDRIPNNNTAWGVTNVQSGNRIMIVQGRAGNGTLLNSLLLEGGYETQLITEQDFPNTIAEMCRFNLIILLDVNAQVIGEKRARLLEEYVSVYGRSILTGGGTNTYIYGHMKDSAFERFLPVSMEVEERSSKEPVALILIIDNSASMSGTAIVMAKRGAVKSIESLNANDFAGIITFSTEHTVLHELSGMDRKDELITKISGIGTMMGTTYSSALEEAHRQLTAFDPSSIKHVILMSDGNPSDSGYETIIQSMAENGITLSTIAVGLDISGENMIRMAQLGRGRSYIVRDSYDLPDIMMTDTILQQVDYLQEGVFTPTLIKRQFGVGEMTLPNVLGYIRTTPKRTADLMMTLKDDHPLYVRWHYGNGIAGSFMSDLNDEWSAEWFELAGKDVLLNMVSELLPLEYNKAAYTAMLRGGGKTAILTIEGTDLYGEKNITNVLISPLGQKIEYPMTLGPDGIAWSEIKIHGFGVYPIQLKIFDDEKRQTTDHNLAAALSWSLEYDAFSNAELAAEKIAEACERTGGVIFEDTEALVQIMPEDAYMENNPSSFLSAIAFLCVLLIAVLQRTNFFRSIK